MKITVLFLTLLPILATSQIEINKVDKKTFEVGQVKPMGVFVASLDGSVYQNSTDTVYALCLRNYKYRSIVDVQCASFSSTARGLDTLYQAMMSFFQKDNAKNHDYTLSVRLSGTDLILKNSIAMGTNTLYVFINRSDYGALTKKQVSKLFGK